MKVYIPTAGSFFYMLLFSNECCYMPRVSGHCTRLELDSLQGENPKMQGNVPSGVIKNYLALYLLRL